jgi:hypothetical protein
MRLTAMLQTHMTNGDLTRVKTMLSRLSVDETVTMLREAPFRIMGGFLIPAAVHSSALRGRRGGAGGGARRGARPPPAGTGSVNG